MTIYQAAIFTMLRGLTIALALSSAAGFVPGSRHAPVVQRRQSASTVKMLGGGSGEPPKGEGILPGLNTQECRSTANRGFRVQRKRCERDCGRDELIS